ncbi:MAG: hypothetical protein ACI8TX_002841 [Hyphomicrobiaceae bacterium]|jgi:hypothetical protein
MYWRLRHSCKARVGHAATMSRRLSIASIVLLLASVAACGGPGSGSSGLGERAAIQEAQRTRECAVATNAVMYCPTDEVNLTGTAENIVTPVVDDVEVECFLFDEIEVVCLFSLSFQPNGFDPDASFVMATRPFDSEELWQVGPETEFFSVEDDGERVPVAFGEAFFDAPDLETTSVQLAIVALPVDSEAGPPTEVASLDELGTTLAFVTPEFASVLTVIPPEDETIELALGANTCVDGGIAFVCPVDTVFDAAQFEPQFGVPLFFFETFVDVSAEAQQPIVCVPFDRRRCRFDLRLRLKGTIEVFYQAAARVVPDDGAPRDWRIGEEIFDPTEEPEDERILVLPVELDTRDLDGFASDGEGGHFVPIQIAVMPDPIPITQLRLVDTLDPWVGFYAFVTEPVTIQVLDR